MESLRISLACLQKHLLSLPLPLLNLVGYLQLLQATRHTLVLSSSLAAVGPGSSLLTFVHT
jgi:hypothetical protein